MIIDQVITDTYTAAHGDCVEFLRGLPDQSIGYSIFSPPFASLYTYSNSPATWATSATMQSSSITSIFSSPRAAPGDEAAATSASTAWTCPAVRSAMA